MLRKLNNVLKLIDYVKNFSQSLEVLLLHIGLAKSKILLIWNIDYDEAKEEQKSKIIQKKFKDEVEDYHFSNSVSVNDVDTSEFKEVENEPKKLDTDEKQ